LGDCGWEFGVGVGTICVGTLIIAPTLLTAHSTVSSSYSCLELGSFSLLLRIYPVHIVCGYGEGMEQVRVRGWSLELGW
jgi:hypothetical protein